MLGLRDKLRDAPFLKEQGVDGEACVKPQGQDRSISEPESPRTLVGSQTEMRVVELPYAPTRRSTTAFITGGQTPLPSSLI